MTWQDDVLTFWFEAADDAHLGRLRNAWFAKDADFDATIRARFLPLVEALEEGTLVCRPGDTDDARATLAWTIVADQFPRNLFRGEARAFASDAHAREVVRVALARGLDAELPAAARWFLYLPLEHSESLADQDESVRRFESLPEGSPGRAMAIEFAEKHRVIIARFGRFPHRNAALGRTSTQEELAFLAEPGSSF